MISSVLDHDEIVVRRDVAVANWSVEVEADRFEVREWTWGERVRLIESCLEPNRFDRSGFTDRLVELLVEPTPSGDAVAVLAAIALRLQGVDPDAAPPATLLDSERRLIAEWGWTFDQLDKQSACRIDRHLQETPALRQAANAAGPEWNSIVVLDD